MSLRDRPLGDAKPPLTWLAVVALVVAMAVCLAIFVGDRKAGVESPVRRSVDGVLGSVEGVLSTPVHWFAGVGDAVGDYVMSGSQNQQLRLELAQSQALKDENVALKEENRRLYALLGVKTDPPLARVFARTVLDARGPFANTRLANAGADQGVVEGNPVMADHGLVGRVTGVAGGVSRIMLLTDVESRTPVLIVRTNGRAILTGDGGANPKLAYLRTHDPLREGDRVLTSGDGGVFPRGLPVGVATRGMDGDWRVVLDSDAAPIDFVQILLFKDFSQAIAPTSLAPSALPGLGTDAPTDPQATIPSPVSMSPEQKR